MKKRMIAALLFMALMPAVSGAAVSISGYLDVGYIAAEGGVPFAGYASNRLQASGATAGNWDNDDGFALNDLNIDINATFTDSIKGYASWNFGTGGASVVDFAEIDFYDPFPMVKKLSVGRQGSVVGIEQRVSESNLNKFINMTLLSPWTVGSIDGLAIYGSFSPVDYQLAVSNSDNIDLTGAGMGTNIRPPAIAGAAGAFPENNNDKAVSGRIGVKPIEGLEVGVSGSYNPWVNGGVTGTNLPRTLVGVDAGYTWGALGLKGEYITVSEEQTNNNPQIRASGFYVEGLYDWSARLALGVRYANMEIEQGILGGNAIASQYSTTSFAACYKIADSVLFKAEYDINQEKMVNRTVVPSSVISNKSDNNVFALSLVGTF